MSSFQQIVRPNLNAQDGAGWCLRHTQRVFNAPARYPDAWTAWNNQSGRRFDALPTDASVPVWFEHWGTYNGIYKNWGHVATWVPGRGIYSSPRSGYGGEWFNSIADIERSFNARYVGWTTSIHDMPVVRQVSTNKPTPKEPEVTVYRRKDRNSRRSGRTLSKTQGLYLNEKNGTVSQATNIIGAVGEYIVTLSVYAKGKPGDALDVFLVRQNRDDPKNHKNSNGYIERMEIGPTGHVNKSVTFQIEAPEGEKTAIFARAAAPSSNKGNVTLTVFDSAARV